MTIETPPYTDARSKEELCEMIGAVVGPDKLGAEKFSSVMEWTEGAGSIAKLRMRLPTDCLARSRQCLTTCRKTRTRIATWQ